MILACTIVEIDCFSKRSRQIGLAGRISRTLGEPAGGGGSPEIRLNLTCYKTAARDGIVRPRSLVRRFVAGPMLWVSCDTRRVIGAIGGQEGQVILDLSPCND